MSAENFLRNLAEDITTTNTIWPASDIDIIKAKLNKIADTIASMGLIISFTCGDKIIHNGTTFTCQRDIGTHDGLPHKHYSTEWNVITYG